MNELKQLCDGLAQSLEELAALLREFPTEAEPEVKVPPASKEDPMEKIYNITPTYEAQPQAQPQLQNVDVTPAQVNDDPLDAINQ